MRFFSAFLSGAALITAALAVQINDFPPSVQPGKTYTITYSPADNTPTTLILRKGKSGDLTTIATLTTTATGGKFQWTVDSSLPNGNDYALEIQQKGADPNFIGPISVSGSSAKESSTKSATKETASSTEAESATKTKTTSKPTTLATTIGKNSTITAATPTSSEAAEPTSGGETSTETGRAPAATGAASQLGSSTFALIFGAMAAMVALN